MLADAFISQDTRRPRAPRERAFLEAKIAFANGTQSAQATVVQISATGAKLSLSADQALPDVFDFSVPQKGLSTRARLVWRRDNMIGISFQQATAEPTAVFSAADAQTRIETLEAENAKLKKRNGEMAAQLARINET